MGIGLLIGLGVMAALSYFPGWWVGQVMRRHSEPADRFDFSGADLARYLLDHHHLEYVAVEQTKSGIIMIPRIVPCVCRPPISPVVH